MRETERQRERDEERDKQALYELILYALPHYCSPFYLQLWYYGNISIIKN